MKNSGQTFMKGALILAIANFIVKIIGAVFKIPLYELIGKEGSGLFNVAYQIYTFMFIIATAFGYNRGNWFSSSLCFRK